MTTYFWKPQAGVPVPAQAAGEELERIRVSRNGRLTQEDVVQEARNKDNPLHPAFEWNDKKAAHQYRLTQAGYVIRMITMVGDGETDQGKEPIRAFVNVRRDEDRSYTSVVHAMSDAELRAQVLAQAWKELQDWRKRHSELVEFARLFAVIENMQPQKAA